MNDSASTISPAWPTNWPTNSFKNFWTWALAASIAGFFVLLFAAKIALGNAVDINALTPSQIMKDLWLQFVLEGAFVGLLIAAMPALSKVSLRDLGFRKPTAGVLAFAVLGAVAMVFVANGSATLIESLLHSKHEQDVVEVFKNLHGRADVASFIFFAVVFAPLTEEAIFRIFFFNLGLRFGGFWSGAIVSGVLFGIAHGDLMAALPLALGGVVLCYVYYRTRNAWASMIAHALFNSLSIAAFLFAPNLAS